MLPACIFAIDINEICRLFQTLNFRTMKNKIQILITIVLISFIGTTLTAQSFKKIENRWKSNHTIHAKYGKVECTLIADGDLAALWSIEPVAGTQYFKLKNNLHGTYLHNQNGILEQSNIQNDWWSAMWIIESVPGASKYKQIKNRWKGTYLHNQNGKLELGTIQAGWWSAMWELKDGNSTSSTAVSSSTSPNITGKYKYIFEGIQRATFKIIKTSNGIYIDSIAGTESNASITADAGVTASYGAGANYDWNSQYVGNYTWIPSEGAYKKGAWLIYKVNDQKLAIRTSGRHHSSMEKIQSSLSDLANSQRNNVSHLLGNWKIAGTQRSIKLMAGVDHDLLIYADVEIYELDKTDGSLVEKFEGFARNNGEELIVTVISNDELKLDFGSNQINATRIGAATASTLTPKGDGASAGINQANSSGDTKLHLAVRKSEIDQAEELMTLGAEINAKNNLGKTPLHEAIQKNDADIAGLLLDNNADVNITDNQNNTPLDVAIRKSTTENMEIVNMLLEKTPTITTKNLDAAILKKNNELMTSLLVAGADPVYVADKAVEKGNLPLFETVLNDYSDRVTMTNGMFDKAISSKKYMIADVMISRGFDPNYAMTKAMEKDVIDLVYTAMQEGGNATSALSYAIKKKDLELATSAINDYGADASAGLVEAVQSNNIPMVDLLINNGADPSSGMETAVNNKSDKMVTKLLESGAQADAQLENASTLGYDNMVKAMLQHGADPNLGVKGAANAEKMSTLKILLDAQADANPVMPIAIEKDNAEMVTAALEAGADGTSPEFIDIACKKGNASIVSKLLEAGANADDGIASAVSGNFPTIVEKLINAGADGSQSGLLVASVYHNNTTLTGLLLEAGANAQDGVESAANRNASNVLNQLINAGADAKDQSLLNSIVKKNYTATADILLNLGLDANAEDASSGMYLIHFAAKNNSRNMANLLISKGADVNVTTAGSGDTPLHLAVAQGKKALGTAETLINAGADVNARNAKNQLVFKAAKSSKMKKLLKNNGAQKK